MPAPTSTPPTPLYLCNPFVGTRLVTGKFKTIVQLPKYSELDEWVALNLFEFYTNLNLFMPIVAESCQCPSMSASETFSYSWRDPSGRVSRIAARSQMDYIMTYVDRTFNDQTLFPTRIGTPLPPSSLDTAKIVYASLLQVFAHIFHAHFPTILHARSEGHLNSLFAHFLEFGQTFNLLSDKDLSPEGSNGPNTMLGIGLLAQEWREMSIIT